MMDKISQAIRALAAKRPVFHSEADFQHALAWECHQRWPGAEVRLELPMDIDGQNLHLDLWIATPQRPVAIELKYKTRGHSALVGTEHFHLKDQVAQPLGRYDFIKDVERLERIVTSQRNTVGYAIFLTNDSAYWMARSQRASVDADFRLFPGRILSGELGWSRTASAGTTRGREEPLTLKGNYTLNWHEYSRLGSQRYGRFRYLLLEVTG